MRVLHTESSNNWGGQEMRILKEAIGMRSRGHDIYLAVQRGGKLVERARQEGFLVYEIDFSKRRALFVLYKLTKIIRTHAIEIVNTHSSLDSWLGGIAARLTRRKVIRTRHLSTPIRKGLNSRLLYNALADAVVTTSSAIVPIICAQAKIGAERCRCIPTGVEPFSVDPEEVRKFRASLGLKEGDILLGTTCIVRSWKGIQDILKAADILRNHSHLKWVVVGGGYIDQYEHLFDLRGILTFTGHLDNPHVATAAMDIFLLLSTAHEGISQASLQAAYLEKPLITTDIGGLPEVCLHEQTGLVVPPRSPEKVVEAVLRLSGDRDLRKTLGQEGINLVTNRFLFTKTLDRMEEVYYSLSKKVHP